VCPGIVYDFVEEEGILKIDTIVSQLDLCFILPGFVNVSFLGSGSYHSMGRDK
jgi:hypothetical protein